MPSSLPKAVKKLPHNSEARGRHGGANVAKQSMDGYIDSISLWVRGENHHIPCLVSRSVEVKWISEELYRKIFIELGRGQQKKKGTARKGILSRLARRMARHV